MSFADDFRAHVTPRLRVTVQIQGLYAGCGFIGFTEALSAISSEASYFGAGHLPPEIYDDLIDWMASALLARVVEVEAWLDEIDPFTSLGQAAAGCAHPELMRWVFASVDPAYRNHLRATIQCR